MSIDRQHAVVFTTDCRVIKVRREDGMIPGKEIMIHMNRDQSSIVPLRQSRFRWPALVAACLVIVLVVAILLSQGLLFNPVYARLSIDVNPSIEFDLDRQLNVRAVHTMNEKAVQVLGEENLEGLPWQEAVEQWAFLLRERLGIVVHDMLISAIVPDQDHQLTNQLMAMEGTQNQGVLSGLQVRVIYSEDPAVVRAARQNGLSVGRQMLLTQAREQKQSYDESSIADAPLGDLIRKLLRDGEANQTGMTRRETRSIADTSTPESQSSGETNQEQNRETNQAQNSDTSQGSSMTNQETNQERNGQTDGEPQGSTVHAITGSQNQQGSQADTSCQTETMQSQATNRETSQMCGCYQSQTSEPQGSTVTQQSTSQSESQAGTGTSNTSTSTSGPGR